MMVYDEGKFAYYKVVSDWEEKSIAQVNYEFNLQEGNKLDLPYEKLRALDEKWKKRKPEHSNCKSD